MKKKQMTMYLVLTVLVCLIPLIGLLWKKSAESSENRVLSSFPVLKTEEGWNFEFLSDAGNWFEEHFAYRQEMVTADALLRGTLFGVSTEDGVIKGTDGWLYYKDSLSDYLGDDLLSDRSIFNIAHTLKMMQDYVEQNGGDFLFTVAPNKNSLYDEHMPYYYRVKAGQTRNIDKLIPVLQSQGVHYVDLHAAFESQDEVLYHMRDSHWNNKGAALAAEMLFDALGRAHPDYAQAEFTVEKDYEGDLDAMLYPLAITAEDEIYYTDLFSYEYVTEVGSNFDPEIQTTQMQATGGLLMYRDSFGNALLPFMAQEYQTAKFSRGIPYYLDDMFLYNADTVIVERAERFLPDMTVSPPVVQAPEVQIELPESSADSMPGTSCQVANEGMYIRISGAIDESLMDKESRIYLQIDGNKYEAFPMNITQAGIKSDYGYTAYIERGRLQSAEISAELYVDTNGEIRKVYQTTANIS